MDVLLDKIVADLDRRIAALVKARDALREIVLEPESSARTDSVPAPVSEAARMLGKRGGSKGGSESSTRLSPEKRKERAQAAAKARWTAKKAAGPSGHVKPVCVDCGGERSFGSIERCQECHLKRAAERRAAKDVKNDGHKTAAETAQSRDDAAVASDSDEPVDVGTLIEEQAKPRIEAIREAAAKHAAKSQDGLCPKCGGPMGRSPYAVCRGCMGGAVAKGEGEPGARPPMGSWPRGRGKGEKEARAS